MKLNMRSKKSIFRFRPEKKDGCIEGLGKKIDASQCAERILNKIANPFNKTYTGWKNMIQGFQTHFAWNPKLKGIESLG